MHLHSQLPAPQAVVSLVSEDEGWIPSYGMSSIAFTHRQAQLPTCLVVNIPAHNSQGNGPLPQRC